MSGGGQFRLHPRFGEVHPVIPRLRRLLLVRKLRAEPLCLQQPLDLTVTRRDEQIAQVRAAGARQVRVAETQDGLVRVMVARAAVPALRARVRADLHEPERNRRAGISVPMPAGADQRQRFIRRLRRGPGAAGGYAGAHGGHADKVMDGANMRFHICGPE